MKQKTNKKDVKRGGGEEREISGVSRMAERIALIKAIAGVYEDLPAAENMLLQCCASARLDMRIQ